MEDKKKRRVVIDAAVKYLDIRKTALFPFSRRFAWAVEKSGLRMKGGEGSIEWEMVWFNKEAEKQHPRMSEMRIEASPRDSQDHVYDIKWFRGIRGHTQRGFKVFVQDRRTNGYSFSLYTKVDDEGLSSDEELSLHLDQLPDVVSQLKKFLKANYIGD